VNIRMQAIKNNGLIGVFTLMVTSL